MICSKYCGFNHSPKKESTRSLDFRCLLDCPNDRRAMACAKSWLCSAMGVMGGERKELDLPVFALLLGLEFASSGGWYCAMPADIATLVCTHRKNGEV